MFKRFRQDEKGQGLVEFALVVPILLLLLVAIVDVGWFVFAKTNLNNAAREGARVYAVHDDVDQATTAAASYLNFLNGNYSISFAKTAQVDNNQAGICTVSSRVSPLVGLIYSGPIDIEAKAQMRLEYIYK